ncbi:MAG: histidine kinase [Actinobacteria bacterium]|nr:histidine kinase [Actinomycetota bacterium]MCG2800744.1 histidine kinase [Cellulomonas sp.]
MPDERLPADLPDQPSGEPAPDDLVPTPDDAPPTPDDAPPTEEWLLAHAVEGRVRRAPRLGSFVVAGVLAGLVLGTVLTLVAIRGSGLSSEGSGGVLPMLGGYNGVVLVTSAALGLVGGLVGAALGVRADRRSRR